MSGRGRRGPNSKTPIPVANVGLNKNELNQNVLTAPDLYPPTFFRPLKIDAQELDQFLVKTKLRLRNHFKNSQYYLKDNQVTKTIERYSDKYEVILNKSTDSSKVFNYSLFPDELKPKMKTIKKEKDKNLKSVNFEEIKTKLEKLEGLENEKENSENEDEENEEEIEAGLIEEEIEEETDYALSYFDNGEDYLNESDDNLGDEATF